MITATQSREVSLSELGEECLTYLTVSIQDRSVGSPGNQAASSYLHDKLAALGWTVESQWFDAMDWQGNSARLTSEDGTHFEVFSSPYALGCAVSGRLEAVSAVNQIETGDLSGSLLLLHGQIAQEALVPKRFPFFSLEAHQRIIAGLESSGAAALICATASFGDDPVPMIEDGDFDLPSVYTTPETGARLLPYAGQGLRLVSDCLRHPARAANTVARINTSQSRRMVITAHIDAKKGSPGALDNGSGIATLLLLGHLLAGYAGKFCIELVALNGEDHYAVPGQMAFLSANEGRFGDIALNINIDGVGYRDGATAYSFFELPDGVAAKARGLLLDRPGTCEGPKWPQGDHSMFIHAGCPAIAVTSEWLLQNMATQTVTHSLRDRKELVSLEKAITCAENLKRFIEAM